MFSIFLLSLVHAKRKICICNLKCSSFCPTEKYITTSSNSLIQYINKRIDHDNEIEMNFYSPEDNFVFEINLTHFLSKKLTLKNIPDSKTINLHIKKEIHLLSQTVIIEPNFQIDLPDLTPYKSTTNFHDKAILTDSSNPAITPIPISVGMAQMRSTGSVSCSPENVQFDIDNIFALNCEYENLNSESAYQCGFRCWTAGETSFEYSFKGVKFVLYGTYDPLHETFLIKIDDNEPIEVNEHSDNRQTYKQVFISDELEYKEHTILIYGSNVYELYKLAYWPSLKARRLNSTEFEKTLTWTKESDGVGGVREYTSDVGATASVELRTSKVWFYGTRASDHNEMTIKFNDQTKTVSQNSGSRVEGALLYESDELDFGTYKLDINVVQPIILIYCVYYQYDPPPETPTISPDPTETPEPTFTPDPTATPLATPEPTPTPSPVPISIGLTQLNSTGPKSCSPESVEFDKNNVQKIGCNYNDLESPGAYNCGYRCWGSQMNFEYNFKGVKFQVYGTNDPLHGSFDLVIDNGNPIEINEYRENRQAYALLYTSEELEYGEHNIKILNKDNTYEMYKISYWPWIDAKRVNMSDFVKTGNWKTESDGIGGSRQFSDSIGATATITIPCSKIWVYGSTADWYSTMKLKINGEEKTIIDPRSDERMDTVLLYESSDFYFDNYTLLIESSIFPINLYAVYYVDTWAIPTKSPTVSMSPEPTLTATESPNPSMTPEPSSTPDPTFTVSMTPEPSDTPLPSLTQFPMPTPAQTSVPISVGLTQFKHEGRVYCNVAYFGIENLQNLGCNTENLEVESAYKCGYKCWSYGETNFSYTFKGVKFEIYGTFDPSHRKFDLTIDDKPPIEVDEHADGRLEYVVIYSSDLLDYREHTIKITGKGEIYELYKLVYWPMLEAKRLNSTELYKSDGWIRESDGIGGVREYTNQEGRAATISIICTKIWVYSSISNNHDHLILNFDDQQFDLNLKSDNRVDASLVFESEDVMYGRYSITFYSTGTTMLYCIYYLNDPPLPTNTPHPSRTSYPETNMTYIDRIFTNYILTDQIEVIEDSPIDQISGCRFINILENIDYLIRIEKEIPFFDNYFEYEMNQPYPCSPLLNNFNGHFSIVNCTFINSRGRVRRGGNVFTSHLNYIIDLCFESCTFINCGNLTNETIIKIMNNDSTLKMIDCMIKFDNEINSSKVIDVSCSSVVIDNCEFQKSGTILIDTSNFFNSSFQFTNNKVSLISQLFINITKLTSCPLIDNNHFHDISISNSSFISIVHFLNEIEFKNNTFESIKNDRFDSFCFVIEHFNHNCSTIIFSQCTFVDNENNRSSDSIFCMGGAFQFGFDLRTENCSVNFLNCEFNRNTCFNGKGGALALSVLNDVLISDCVFSENSAEDEDGSSIFIIGNSTQKVQHPLNSVSIKNCQFMKNHGKSCICLQESNIQIDSLEISSCLFIDNICTNSRQFLVSSSSNDVTFSDNNITFSESSDKFGSLYINHRRTAYLSNSSFINCQASSDSTMQLLAENDLASLTVYNCSFIDCISRQFSVRINQGISIVRSSSFTFKSSRNACSGLEIKSPISIEATELVFNNNNNKIPNSGSIYIHDEGQKVCEKLTINGLLFGSCIGSSFRTLCLSFKNFKEDQIVLEKVEIQNISTGASIYGIDVEKDVNFVNCRFMNNQFGNELGGGLGSYLIPSCHITFTDCKWSYNYCSDNGGGFGGVLYSKNGNSPLLIKSLTFTGCTFVQNSCLGNGGALYLDMTLENSTVTLVGCSFELNRANGDCGAVYARNAGLLRVESCCFVNNSAFKSMASYNPTDGLAVKGHFTAIIDHSNFTKGSYTNEVTNYQFSHVNLDNDVNYNDFNVTISFCMFSIINPNSNQVFAKEVDNIGQFFISNSMFTHFTTRTSEANAGLMLDQISPQYKELEYLNKVSQSDFNHLFQELNTQVHITNCCFDTNEFIVKSTSLKKLNEDTEKIENTNQTFSKTSFEKLNDNGDLSLLISQNNVLNGQCSYPKIIDDMLQEIENNAQAPSGGQGTSSPTTPKNYYDKKKNTIILCSVAAACLVVIVVVIVTLSLVLRHRRLKMMQQQTSEDEDTNGDENEKNFMNFATRMVTQENPLYTQAKAMKLPSDDSDSRFEESNWREEVI